ERIDKEQDDSTDDEDNYNENDEAKRHLTNQLPSPFPKDDYSECNSVTTSSLHNKTVVWIATNINTEISRVHNSLYLRLLSINQPEMIYITMGCFCSIISGLLQPAFSLLYAEVYQIQDFLLINTFYTDKMVVVGSQQETLDLGFVLLGTCRQGLPVILKELMLSDGFISSANKQCLVSYVTWDKMGLSWQSVQYIHTYD
ncbi:unnamed protein product, partial [Schistosoma mattheei]